jgi:hypothetical protein
VLFKNGRIFILEAFNHNAEITDSVNKILLIGYYLSNLGYAALMINRWEHVTTVTQLVASITLMVGRIVLGLALMHYINMVVIYFLRKNKSFIS